MTPIRDIVADYMHKNDYRIAQFADYSGMNPGTLSRLIQGIKPISFKQLVQITQGMGLSEDYFFDRYVHECVATPSLRRIRPFILRCAKLERFDCIERLVFELLEDNSYVSAMFEIAEELYADKLLQAAKFIYLRVSEAEKYQHSERLALCRYRLFVISLGTDLEANYRAAMVFEDYVDRLDEMDQLDALKHLINVFMAVHHLTRVDELAKKLLQLANNIYFYMSENRDAKEADYPIFYYILYAWLALSTVCEGNQNYAAALEYVALYSSADSWVKEDSERAIWHVNQFKEWGKANSLLYKMNMGNAEALHEYADYIADHPNEIFYALGFIVKAANQFSYDIDSILERFNSYVPINPTEYKHAYYKDYIMAERYVQFLTDLVDYRTKKDSNDAILLILEALRLSIDIRSVRYMASCMALFEKYREWSSPQSVEVFESLKSEVYQII
ncbi:helix-turn-helix domain-containing protein [Paenibacillus massiliensis]|uniref:helix-turn-helix domain-containing protein n=1 Tax=Paenibacillus massiliensis TaxID=225917 RepID=UPI00036F6516|nr:helix-turn-helix transcriptional regulator [Paenibacillus massiliensis]